MRLVLPLALALTATPCMAATLLVGDGGLPTLAAAVQAATDGDTIRIGPGDHYECAILTQRRLTIEGTGPTSVLTDHACQGKALLVAQGADLTVRDLVLARVRVPDHNGAGIRLEAPGLTLERVRFEDDEVGVLGGQSDQGTVRVLDCVFHGGGVAGDHPTAALMLAGVALLDVERSRFEDVKGTQIESGAAQTVLVDDHLSTGVAPGAGPGVQVTAGTLLMRGNVLAVGPNPPSHDAAVLALGDRAELRDNRLVNTTGQPQRLLLDWTSGDPVLDGNTVAPGDTLVSSAGLWRHRAGVAARSTLGAVRHLAGDAKRAGARVFGR